MSKKSAINLLLLAVFFGLTTSVTLADDAVFNGQQNQTAVQEVNIKPAEARTVPQNAEVEAVNTQSPSDTLSNEKFKSAVNNLESAQVDVREQLATYKALVEQKELDVNNRKAELSKLKREYSALQKKMKNIEKMKKMLNNNII